MYSGRLWIWKKHMIRQMQRVYAVGGKLLNGVQSFNVDSKASPGGK